MDKKIEKLLITHANLNKNEECCGFIVLDTFKKLLIIPCDNIYQFPRQGFKICPRQFLKIKQKHEIVCMYHSHPDGDHEFSQKDLEQSEELCLPICVYSLKTEEFNIHFPNSCEINEFAWTVLEGNCTDSNSNSEDSSNCTEYLSSETFLFIKYVSLGNFAVSSGTPNGFILSIKLDSSRYFKKVLILVVFNPTKSSFPLIIFETNPSTLLKVIFGRGSVPSPLISNPSTSKGNGL